MSSGSPHAGVWKKFCADKLGKPFHCPPGLPPRGFVVKPDGTVEHVVPRNGNTFHLEEMRRLIGGGTVQCVSFKHFWMVCDDDFKYKKELMRNTKATEAVAEMLAPGDWLAGDILFCSRGAIR